MNTLSRRAVLCGLAFAAVPNQFAVAQDQTIKIVFPFAAGGAADAIARMIAERLQKDLGKPVIVENKTGAGGRIGVHAVKEAAPDGATLLFAAASQFTLQPHVVANLGYDPFADFAPISEVARFDVAVAVSGKFPPRSIKDLAVWLKANPDQAVVGSLGTGTGVHFCAMALAKAFDLDVRHLFYRGTPAALPDLLAGRIPVFISSNAELMEHHRSGGIRIVATAGSDRSPVLPDVPTLKEGGVNFESEGWFAFYASARTPPQLIEQLEKAIGAAARAAEIRQRIEGLGFRATGTTANELKRVLRAEFDAWSTVVKGAGFKPE
jgi:tripartite-type tricarboxylate transporter receptor subunit TctC